MSVLWFALGIYIIGIAVVLFLRPSGMFSASGWKEFGLANTSNYTIFPFWMFAIVWAVVSYAAASLFTLTVASGVIDSNDMNNNDISLNTIATPVSKASSVPAPPASAPPTPSPTLPGYYILEESVKGPAKYVYYGSKPPSIENL